MIIDTLENASNYFNINPCFKGAFEFIKGHSDLEKAAAGPVGTFENLTAFVAAFQGVSKETGLSKFECHDKNIDIQYCIKGKETFGWKPRHKCMIPNGDYNPEKDVRFFSDAPELLFELTKGQFAIFFPEDVHAPMIGAGEIKKLVIKIKR
ncbi:YhcH/YjgK/YiaL family protein [Flavobacterium sp. ZS1P14]|uniref:YhcH/YjgK/YiaL family protein n=1 Tax=Flavobacterium sp. ZS1P14 TaxID=3401729 RepID=UPI003AACAF1B